MALDLVTSEMLVRLIDDALSYPVYLADPRLAAWVPDLEAARDKVRAKLSGSPVSTTLDAAQKEANNSDKLHDRRHRKTHRVLSAFVDDEREAVAAAARLMLGLLYADGLAFINKPFDVEVAHGEKYEERLRRADVQAAIAVLSAPLPELVGDLAGIADATIALRAGLTKIRDIRLAQVAAPLSPELFAARRDAMETWSTFVRVAEKVHKGDEPAKRAARDALLADWKRLVAATNGVPAVDDAMPPVGDDPALPNV